MRKLGKKGVTDILVKVIAIVISLVVLMVVAYKYMGTAQDLGDKAVCIFDTFAGKLGIGSGDGCEMTKITVTGAMIKDSGLQNTAEDRITVWNREKEKYTQIKEFKLTEKEDNKESLKNNFVLDYIMANELYNCWRSASEGRTSIFDRWYTLVECRDEKTGEPCSKEKAAKNAAQSIWEKISKISNTQFAEVPKFCRICARVKFDQSAQDLFKDKKITHLPEMMRNTPIDPSKPELNVPYYTYTMDDVHKGLFENQYVYGTDKPYAVVYVEVPQHLLGLLKDKAKDKILQLFGKNIDNTQKDIHGLILVPYDEVGEICTDLTNY